MTCSTCRGGGYVRSGDDLQELDARGKLRRRRPRPIQGLWMATPTHLVTQVASDGSTRALVLRREDLTPALRLDARLAVVDGEPAGATSLVFLLHRGEQPARALVLR